MSGFYAIYQHLLMIACIAMIGLIVASVILVLSGNALSKLRNLFGESKIQGVIASVAIIGAVMYGGSKGVSVRWDTGLRDNGTLITNDTVAVRWTYSGIPSASSVFIDYREAGSTNEWDSLGETVASALEWTGILANATNYEYWVYSTYIPPVPVHTNGVWVGQTYETKARVGAKAFLILNGKVQEHGRTIAPPAAKRKEENE